MDNVTTIRVITGALSIVAMFLIPLLYVLPTFLARKKRQFVSIMLLNLFLGWTLIGWVCALVWATMVEAPEVIAQRD